MKQKFCGPKSYKMSCKASSALSIWQIYPEGPKQNPLFKSTDFSQPLICKVSDLGVSKLVLSLQLH